VLSGVLLSPTVAFQLEPALIAGCLAAAVTVTVVAAFVPALRAAGLRIVEALHYE
jgi:ABC-type antimicrobial peptide transport system permease subunit